MVSLPADRLPSGVRHSDILKVMMVHCQSFSFECVYEHIEVHQDEGKSYEEISRAAQLNSCMDLDAKSELWGLVGQELPSQQPLPLEAVVVKIGRDKMTAGSEEGIVYWCNKALARQILNDPKVKWINTEQFDEIYWPACYAALSDTKCMFQLFACKQTLSIAGCNQNQAYYTPGHDKKCPSCKVAMETCAHVLACEESGRVEALHRSIELLDAWLRENGTESNLRRFLV